MVGFSRDFGVTGQEMKIFRQKFGPGIEKIAGSGRQSRPILFLGQIAASIGFELIFPIFPAENGTFVQSVKSSHNV